MIVFNANQTVRAQDAPGHGLGGNVKGVVGEYTLSAALTLNQVIPMVAVPKGARVIGGQLTVDDLDTGGSPAIVLAVGDGDDDDRYLTSSTIGQAGGAASFNRHTGNGNYEYTDGDTIDVKVTTAPATGATSGAIRLSVWFIID